jgi:hypothetical protein
MKIIIILVVAIIVIIVVFQSYTLMSANNTEEQKYTVIRKDKDFEIRFYPAATLATIHSNAKTYKELSGPGFRQLARYIFGGNAAKTQISMTAPVHMDVNDSVSTMSFVMPSVYNENNIIIKNTSEEYVAVIRFGGFASNDDLKFYSGKLQNLLKEKGIATYGHYRYLGYNPPYQLIDRRNEIIVSVKLD